MFLARKLARSVKYIVFGAFFYNGERKKLIYLKEVDFVGSMTQRLSSY